ncbi:MAG: acetyl-CoA synthetase [Paraglaciecola sp.]|jgi:acetyl-CoA synthetase
MTFSNINKQSGGQDRLPNLTDYQHSYENFHWQQARDQIKGYGNGVNIAYEAVVRHCEEGNGQQLALICLGKNEQKQTYTYNELHTLSNRFANLLTRSGLEKGHLLCSLAERIPLLYAVVIGAFKAGVVFSPLFSAFGPEPIHSRMEIGGARALFTSAKLYRKKIGPWRNQLQCLRVVLLYNCEGNCPEDCIDVDVVLPQQDENFELCATSAQDTALLHFTSGTTGKPKGVVHVHEAVVQHKYSGYAALDIHPNDIFWCTADPGWVTGISYGIISPLCNRATLIVDEGEFDPARWYRILANEKVNVWYTAPTAIRMLIKAGNELRNQYDLSALRFIASVGEPLNPEAVIWSQKILGLPFHDNWWQTETGGIMLANFASEQIRPGSMGRPLPGIQAGIVKQKSKGEVIQLMGPNETGELALRPGWPSMFRDYLHDTARYQDCFKDGWYLTGDLAYRDKDGYYWFVGRSSDLIKSSGHLIGPFEVESALMEHPAVAEAAVIGIPDPVAGEIVKAFVSLKADYEGDAALVSQLLAHARIKLGASLAPKDIVIKANLPKTRSGKIMRRLLKARELDLPEGDISTLEEDEYPTGNPPPSENLSEKGFCDDI